MPAFHRRAALLALLALLGVCMGGITPLVNYQVRLCVWVPLLCAASFMRNPCRARPSTSPIGVADPLSRNLVHCEANMHPSIILIRFELGRVTRLDTLLMPAEVLVDDVFGLLS